MTPIPIKMHTADAFDVSYKWRRPDGTAQPITGATVEALATRAGVTVALVSAVHDGPGGIQRVRLDGADLAPGAWVLQMRATIAGDTQTDTHIVTVGQSAQA